MKLVSKLKESDKPVAVDSKTITLGIQGGPNLGDLVHAISPPVNWKGQPHPFPFTVCMPIQRGPGKVTYVDDLSVIIVSLHRYSQEGLALRGYFADSCFEGYHRCFDARVAPYLEFGSYRIAGARSGSLTLPKDAYELFVSVLLRRYMPRHW